jgi:mRNA-degrading endonuclease RelE of RelBE toxin-antitoxin system
MEIVFEATKDFETDLRRVGETARRSIVDQLNTQAQFLLKEPGEFYRATLRPHKVQLREGFESTLYVLKTGQDFRVIMTVDDDPIFQQIVITLFRVVKHEEMGTAYRELTDLLYRGWLTDLSEEEAYAH